MDETGSGECSDAVPNKQRNTKFSCAPNIMNATNKINLENKPTSFIPPRTFTISVDDDDNDDNDSDGDCGPPALDSDYSDEDDQ